MKRLVLFMTTFLFITHHEAVLCNIVQHKILNENTISNKSDSIDQNRSERNNLRRLNESKVSHRHHKNKKKDFVPIVANGTSTPSTIPTNATTSRPVDTFPIPLDTTTSPSLVPTTDNETIVPSTILTTNVTTSKPIAPSVVPSYSTTSPSLVPTIDNETSIPSMMPTNLTTSNPVLNFTGQCTSDKPCQICEGDCDNDSECEIGLACYIRDSNTPSQDLPVPGCDTNPPSLFAKDFCYNSTLAPCQDEYNSFCVWVSQKPERCLYYGGTHCRETCGYCRPRPIAPSVVPSYSTTSPSLVPTINYHTPSVIPSEQPLICNISAIHGQTLYIQALGICWKVELFDGGLLGSDSGDSLSCNKFEYIPSENIYSYFNTTIESSNIAEFIDGPLAYSGTFQFMQSSNVVEPLLKIIHWDPFFQEYVLEVTLPSCTTVSETPSISPSSAPSIEATISAVCPIASFFNTTFYLEAQGICWQIEFFYGGTIQAFKDFKSCTKEEFSSTGFFGIFNHVDVVSNTMTFTDGPHSYSGIFQFSRSSNFQPQLIVKGLNRENKEYYFDVVVPSCEWASP